jgi:hypothetical protein
MLAVAKVIQADWQVDTHYKMKIVILMKRQSISLK